MILIREEFLDIFPKDILALTLVRAVEFTIDIIFKAELIYKTPY